MQTFVNVERQLFPKIVTYTLRIVPCHQAKRPYTESKKNKQSLGKFKINSAMLRACLWLVLVPFLLFSMAASEEDAKMSLIEFMEKLSPGDVQRGANWGWNASSDPCIDKWEGISCDGSLRFVKKIVLNELNLTGVLDAKLLCMTNTLFVLSLENNNIVGELSEDILGCKNLTHLYLSGNHFSGAFPKSLSGLSNLKRIDISDNGFSGKLPEMSKVSGLLTFLAENNRFSGEMPVYDFSNLVEYNVSNNDLSGPIPDLDGRFGESSFLGNPGLCGKPLANVCPGKKSKNSLARYLIYCGIAIMVLIVILLISYKVIMNVRSENKKANAVKADDSDSTSSEYKNVRRSEFSVTSAESGMPSSSLLVLSNPDVEGMKFEDLLRAPAELLGRGKHGSTYKVTPNSGLLLAVKRIKDWGISAENFKKRMQKIGHVTHPKVLSVLAYYCSKQEKLLVYEYQHNGSLLSLLQGSQNGQIFDWRSRLNVAATTAESLAFMHDKLHADGIAHGNLKSSNILMNNKMEPCISEYGLMVVENHIQANTLKTVDPTGGRAYATFKVDIYAFGVILLELLTGRLVQNTGFDLDKWVHSVVKEEWTVEVFDKSLTSEGAYEENLVTLLQVALKCTNASPDGRPSIKEVVEMINSIKEQEEGSSISS